MSAPTRTQSGDASVTGAGTSSSKAVHERVLASMVDASADAVFYQDLNGVVRSWNPAAERMYGYTAQEIIGRSGDDLLPQSTREHLTAMHLEARGGRLVRRFDSFHSRRDGSAFPVSVTVAPIVDANGAVIAVATTVADITERVQLAAQLDEVRGELQRQNAALARSNRDLEQFAYVASHDLSEPLRVMTGYVEQLERRYDAQLDDRARRYMRHIVDASVRMRSLIDDLLHYSRFLRASRESAAVDTGAVVQRVLASLATPLGQVAGNVQVGPLPAVWSDPHQLESLLQNLVGNALKFVAPGRVPQVCITAEATPAWVTLIVDDNGIGIAPQYRERVFRMFQRLHVREAYSGTGIGLAIAQQIVELHGGRIWVEDSPLGGARFCCTLPAADDRPVES